MFQDLRILPSSMVRSASAPNGLSSTQLIHGTSDTAGNLPNLQGAEAGELESHYLTTYGSIVRWKGALGVREFSKTEHLFPLLDWGLDK